jgi:hypothetical protein
LARLKLLFVSGQKNEATRLKMKLNWDKLDVQSREEICWGACISEKLTSKSWKELDEWLRVLLADSIEKRSKGKLQLCA